MQLMYRSNIRRPAGRDTQRNLKIITAIETLRCDIDASLCSLLRLRTQGCWSILTLRRLEATSSRANKRCERERIIRRFKSYAKQPL